MIPKAELVGRMCRRVASTMHSEDKRIIFHGKFACGLDNLIGSHRQKSLSADQNISRQANLHERPKGKLLRWSASFCVPLVNGGHNGPGKRVQSLGHLPPNKAKPRRK